MYLAVPALSCCMRDLQSLLWLCGIFIFFPNYFYQLEANYFMWDLQLWYAYSQLRHVGSSSLTKDQTWTPCTGSTGAQPLENHASIEVLHFHVVKMHYPLFSPITCVFAFYLKKPEHPEYLREQKTGRADDRGQKQISPSFLFSFFYNFSIFPYPEIDVSNRQVRLL